MTYPPLVFAPYTPTPTLDAELADLGYACIRGCADQRPITPSLVRSRLAAPGQAPPTLLATVRSLDGSLIAAAALRHPPVPGGTGRLWGPLVHPCHQRQGLGRHLLAAFAPVLHTVDGTVASAEIPDDRPAADAFFRTSGWAQSPDSDVLLKAPLPLAAAPGRPPRVTVRAATPEQDLARIDALYRAARPGDPNAAGAGARWCRDERFHARCLALADDGDRLLAAALVYPLAHSRPGEEPPEALLGNLLLHPDTRGRSDHAQHVTYRALTAAVRTAGSKIARAIVPGHDGTTVELLKQLGFVPHGTIRYYQAQRRGASDDC